MERLERVRKLGALLAQELGAAEELLAACAAHRQALVTGPGETFDDSLERQLKALAACRSFSARRVDATQELAGDLGLGAPCSTGRLLASLPDEQAGALAKPYAELRRINGRIAVENAQNKLLAEHRLDLLQGDFEGLQDLALRALGRERAADGAETGSILSFRA